MHKTMDLRAMFGRHYETQAAHQVKGYFLRELRTEGKLIQRTPAECHYTDFEWRNGHGSAFVLLEDIPESDGSERMTPQLTIEGESEAVADLEKRLRNRVRSFIQSRQQLPAERQDTQY